MLTEEQIRAFARQGIRADTVSKGGLVKMAMTRLKEAFDKSPADGATASRFREPVDTLMSALVAFSESLELAENARKELGE
jgi:hypothetical protein